VTCRPFNKTTPRNRNQFVIAHQLRVADQCHFVLSAPHMMSSWNFVEETFRPGRRPAGRSAQSTRGPARYVNGGQKGVGVQVAASRKQSSSVQWPSIKRLSLVPVVPATTSDWKPAAHSSSVKSGVPARRDLRALETKTRSLERANSVCSRPTSLLSLFYLPCGERGWRQATGCGGCRPGYGTCAVADGTGGYGDGRIEIGSSSVGGKPKAQRWAACLLTEDVTGPRGVMMSIGPNEFGTAR